MEKLPKLTFLIIARLSFFFNLIGLESKKNKRYQLWLAVEMLSDPMFGRYVAIGIDEIK